MKDKKYRMKSEFESKRNEGNIKSYSYIKNEVLSTDTEWVKKYYNNAVNDAQKNLQMKKNDKENDIKYKISLFDENNKLVNEKILKKPALAAKNKILHKLKPKN
ncbi:MAG: hypothetical protein M1168_03150 [Candidatus Marsarchaeota archaeon]|nr:hypothetical protein [Candidatus Marsarchaeota archaeon]MCL5094952.1 hypothetical protein [Candidatus Marsarchaeota archaeon]